MPRGRGDKMGISFGRPAPYNLGGRKKRPKFGAISDNFRLRLRITPERIDVSQIGKVCYQLQPLPRWLKKIRWTLVHKQKRYMGSYWPTQADIFGRKHFDPWGVLPPQIFTRVTDWPSLASAHPNWDGVAWRFNSPYAISYWWSMEPSLSISSPYRDIRLQKAIPCNTSLRMRDITWLVPLCKMWVHIFISHTQLPIHCHTFWAPTKNKGCLLVRPSMLKAKSSENLTNFDALGGLWQELWKVSIFFTAKDTSFGESTLFEPFCFKIGC